LTPGNKANVAIYSLDVRGLKAAQNGVGAQEHNTAKNGVRAQGRNTAKKRSRRGRSAAKRKT